MRSVREILDQRVPGVAELDAMCSSACKVSRLCQLAGRPCDNATTADCEGRPVMGSPLTFPPFTTTLELHADELEAFEEDPDHRPYIWDL